jgi:hypothetical protein
MAKLDVQAYKDVYLKEVEERIMSHKQDVPHFTTENLHKAIMTEMNRADETTWEVEVPDDKEQALKEAEGRIIETISKSTDLTEGLHYG